MSEYKDNRSNIYGVVAMSVMANAKRSRYVDTLSFWKRLEEKYNERKRKWMEAKAKMVSARLAAEHAKQDVDKMRSEAQAVTIHELQEKGSTDEYMDAIDDEFSDVDFNLFTDPGARYYSNLDGDEWQKIRYDIMNIHMKAQMEFEQKRRIFLRRLVLAGCFALALLVVGIYLIWLATLTPEDIVCQFHCDSVDNNLVEDLVNIVFPAANPRDEV